MDEDGSCGSGHGLALLRYDSGGDIDCNGRSDNRGNGNGPWVGDRCAAQSIMISDGGDSGHHQSGRAADRWASKREKEKSPRAA